MALLETTSRWSVFLDEALDEVFNERGKKLDPFYTKYTKTDSIKGTSKIVYGGMAGLGQFQHTPELNPVPYDNYELGAKLTLTPKKYALAWRVSNELLEDIATGDRVNERLEAFKDITERLRDSASETIETLCANLISSANSATATDTFQGAGYDSAALAASTHATKKNPITTWSNLMTGASLSAIQLQSAITSFMTIPSPEGFYRKIPSKFTLVTGPYWAFRGAEILGTTGQVDTANNNINPLRAYNISHVVVPHLGATFDGWALLGDDHGLRWISRKDVTFDKEPDIQVLGRRYVAHFRGFPAHYSPYDLMFNPGP